ncbi:substrate-binding domain-containing protein [Nocardia alni]|uniref:substrate-binding domain-containing protein n=1 Tax=Nocardia alni TaxID=2815723 RepID=UPI001C2143FD|nr:substrate-binding domain-containing protein [Nocardia alni]
MGTHRGNGGSRGVSKGLIFTVVAVLLLIVAVGGWFWLGRHSAAQSRTAAAECVEGPASVPVTVDPDVATEVRAAADRFNATKQHVLDHCVSIAVTVQPSTAMVAGFTAKSWDTRLGPPPALWIPDSSRSVQAMRVPGVIQGTPMPIAVTPIVLAVPTQLRQALQTAKVGWSDLPTLQQGSLSKLGLGSWGSLRMAMPTGDDTLAAAAAVGSAVSGSDPLTDQSAHSGQVVSAISTLAQNAPKATDTTTALTTLASTSGAASAPIHAVAVTEQQLGAKGGLAEYAPTGSNPVADHPAALLSGTWVDQTQQTVAGMFADFLRTPAQQQLFTAAGFSAAPPQPVQIPAKTVLEQVHSVLANPVLGVQSTVLIDTSGAMGTSDGSTTRLTNAVGAISSTLDTMPPGFGVGVWTCSENLLGGDPYHIVSKTAPLSQAHRAELSSALGNISPTNFSSDSTYPALEAAYKSAVNGFATARTNSVLLITAGPGDSSAGAGNQLLTNITAATDPAHPVRINVIVLGNQGATALQTVAKQTGGTYTKLASSDDLAFGTAVNNALTAP